MEPESEPTKLVDAPNNNIDIKPKWNIHDDKENKTLTTYREESSLHADPKTEPETQPKFVLRTKNIQYIKNFVGLTRERVIVENFHFPSRIGAYISLYGLIAWIIGYFCSYLAIGEEINAYVLLWMAFMVFVSVQRDYAAWEPVKKSVEDRYKNDPDSDATEAYSIFTGYYMCFVSKSHGKFDQEVVSSGSAEQSLSYTKLPKKETPKKQNPNEKLLEIERFEHVEDVIKQESQIFYMERTIGPYLIVLYASAVYVIRLFVIVVFAILGLPVYSIYMFDLVWSVFGIYTMWKYIEWIAYKNRLLNSWQNDKAIRKYSHWDPVSKWIIHNK